MNQKIKLIIGMIIGFILSIGLDQWTKLLAVKHLMNRAPFVIWDGVFELLYSENRGAAFGMLQGKQVFFLLVALAVLSGAAFAVSRMPADKKYLPLHLIAMFLSAGAVGNMIDRFTRGYVVDFLYFKLINFPIFNIADCYVTVSMSLFMLLFLIYYKEEDLSCLSFPKKEGKD
ncbi:signal peptidase II [Lacrimispora saccharolytica]|uniref:Lipoprotein signal peptidase n=1 Tax=Lacrimispora saccharolytica (strain ATCC 35040 / DSM 2544 / NRCC 2533 / WM1) TaxID=610130 RepID=D9R162_LACSW|nr:signal peptidase II [Lacrimispora saccharolytica]ADL04609.1 lipoprotein signal peptidase [[Clostridium] saccharolyticum WM1]QRV21150.1 signal peptidase II [Lacrimispora saccharolytica]